jgi:hypothetical protein
MTKKALFLRLSPKKVDFIPKKVDFIPKTACLQALLWQGFGIPSKKTNTEKSKPNSHRQPTKVLIYCANPNY